MTPATLRQRLIAGDTLFGTLIVSPSPRWPDVVRGCGLDFVFIDTEHIALDRADLSWMCQTYAALGLPPLVRIPSPDPYAAGMALGGIVRAERPVRTSLSESQSICTDGKLCVIKKLTCSGLCVLFCFSWWVPAPVVHLKTDPTCCSSAPTT
ncbi:MAG: HpcH/HpaI aldolase family protein [Planctomycetota bacterium]